MNTTTNCLLLKVTTFHFLTTKNSVRLYLFNLFDNSIVEERDSSSRRLIWKNTKKQ
jgi:hypothetical protein